MYALAALGNLRTISLGSTSKSFWGGLRVGWIRAEESLIEKIMKARSSIDLGTPILEQLAAVHLLHSGDSLLQARRQGLAERSAFLLERLTELLPTWRATPPRGGICIWAKLPSPISNILAATAESFAVRITPGTRFGLDGASDRFVRLPYTRSQEEVSEGLARLAKAYVSLSADCKMPALHVAPHLPTG